MLAEGRLQVGNELHHLLLGACGEVLGHIFLAESFGKDTVWHGEGALPTGTLLLYAAYNLLEGEVGVDEVVAEVGGGGAYIGCCHVVAERLYVGVVEHFGHGGIVGGLTYYYGIDVEFLEVEVALEVDAGVLLHELGNGRGIVLGGDVALLGACHLLFGQARLYGHHEGRTHHHSRRGHRQCGSGE